MRDIVAEIGFDSYADDLSGADSRGLGDQIPEMLVHVYKRISQQMRTWRVTCLGHDHV